LEIRLALQPQFVSSDNVVCFVDVDWLFVSLALKERLDKVEASMNKELNKVGVHMTRFI